VFGLDTMVRSYRRLYAGADRQRLLRPTLRRILSAIVPRQLILWRGPARRAVAVTFDDGPDATYTPQILEILRRYDASATFFLIGEKAASHPGLVERILRDGHEIANHSYTHPDFVSIGWRAAFSEIGRTQTLLGDIQGRAVSCFRPPKGRLTLAAVLAAWFRRLTVVMWSVDLKDFCAERSEQILQRLADRPICDGDVVLYHGHTHAALAALPAVLESARRSGRRLVPVSDLCGPIPRPAPMYVR
jgi:peptidoglycan-N-acetylglucosamine deacetylase